MTSEKIDLDFLVVDEFLGDYLDVGALAAAFDLGLIDHLAGHEALTKADMIKQAGGEAEGLDLLLGMLAMNGVIEHDDRHFALSRKFRKALDFRDLLESKLDFAKLAIHDAIDLLPLMVKDLRGYTEHSRIFDLFTYESRDDYSDEDLEKGRRWVNLTSCFTRYEAGSCIAMHDFSRYRRILDVGGNSGEFALGLCRANPGLRVAVFDLPLVCDIGREHVSGEKEASRIDFVKGDFTLDPLPAGSDCLTFKSVLHDWPDAEAGSLLKKAYDSLDLGGRLLIFERLRVDTFKRKLTLPVAVLMPFFLFLRNPESYEDMLRNIGFHDIKIQTVKIDMDFMLVTAKK